MGDEMQLRVLASGVLLVALNMGAAHAEDFADPVKLITAIYDQYASKKDFPDGDFMSAQQSDRLNALYAADAKEAGDEIGRIDFDPYVNGQDYEIKKLKIDKPLYAGGKAIVHVTFDNFNDAQDLGMALVKQGDGWKVDDIWSGGEYPFDLLDILQAPLPK
jgi:hypothetical protein